MLAALGGSGTPAGDRLANTAAARATMMVWGLDDPEEPCKVGPPRDELTREGQAVTLDAGATTRIPREGEG